MVIASHGGPVPDPGADEGRRGQERGGVGEQRDPGTGRLGPAVAAPSPAAAAQVIAAYTAYFPALTAAEPQPEAKAAGTLASYAAQPYLGHMLEQMAWYRANDEVAWGYFVPHVTSVQITGSLAVVRDCQDSGIDTNLIDTDLWHFQPDLAGAARADTDEGHISAMSDAEWLAPVAGEPSMRCCGRPLSAGHTSRTHRTRTGDPVPGARDRDRPVPGEPVPAHHPPARRPGQAGSRTPYLPAAEITPG